MKKGILKELGEEELLLPELVNAALAANERIKYYFTLLQTAQSRALHPDSEFPGLKIEREPPGLRMICSIVWCRRHRSLVPERIEFPMQERYSQA